MRSCPTALAALSLAAALLLFSNVTSAAEPTAPCVAAAREWIMAGRFPERFEPPEGFGASDCTGAIDAAYRRMDSERDAAAKAVRDAEDRAAQASAAERDRVHKKIAADQRAYSARAAKEKADRDARAKRPDPAIGMSAEQVETGSNWGPTTGLSRRVTASRTIEIRHYGAGRTIVFTDGRASAIETSY